MNAGELPLAQAFADLAAMLPSLRDAESVPAATAQARVLAENVVSIVDSPSFDNSAMDGYALRFDDLRPGHWLPVHPGWWHRLRCGRSDRW